MEQLQQLWFWLWISLILSSCLSAEYGVGGNNQSAICIQTQQEIDVLLQNAEQIENGIEGGTLIKSECQKLVEGNVLNANSQAQQRDLCANSCYDQLNGKYKVLLDNHCFDMIADEHERANGKMRAAGYQIACQQNTKAQYCLPLLGTLLSEANANRVKASAYCAEIATKLGCCFQSYKLFIDLAGTSASVAAIDKTQADCSASEITTVCPCGFNVHAFDTTTFCSDSHRTRLDRTLLVLTTTVTLLLIWL